MLNVDLRKIKRPVLLYVFRKSDNEIIRQRILYPDGRCKWVYKTYDFSDDTILWKGLTTSCFVYYKIKRPSEINISRTLYYMEAHDARNSLESIPVMYLTKAEVIQYE